MSINDQQRRNDEDNIKQYIIKFYKIYEFNNDKYIYVKNAIKTYKP